MVVFKKTNLQQIWPGELITSEIDVLQMKHFSTRIISNILPKGAVTFP